MESTPAGRPIWGYGIHDEVNSKEGGKGENRDRNGDGNGESGPAGTE